MEQSPSWEANRFSASQEIQRIYGTWRFITAFTSAHQLSLFIARSIQSMPSHSTFWRLILSSHLRLGLPSCLFPTRFPTEPCMHLYSPPYVLHVSPISNTLQLLMTNTIRDKLYKFLCLSATSLTHFTSCMRLISPSQVPNFIRISSKCLPSVHKLQKHAVCFSLCSL